MTHRTLFFHMIISILCLIYSPATITGQNKMGMSQMQMQDFERELEEANKAIEEYVSSLSPAEQADFNRQVEEMSRMFENMSEDEFEKFLGDMFAEEPVVEANPFEAIQPVVIPETAEVVLSTEDKKKAETAIKILDDIIKNSNLFMVLINSSPELSNRITRWGAKGTIANWQSGANWDAFKKQLEEFVQQLYKVQEQDLSKQYKYLLNLIADEALYNNLIQLQTSLNSLVPTINLPEFSIQKLSTQSKTAIKNILQKYTEAFYLLTIPQSLNALFEKYAPEAEKIKAAEEAAQKKALESARYPRTPAAATEAGYTEGGYEYGSPYYGGDYGYGYNPYDYGSYGGDYGYSPDYGYGSEGGAGDAGTSGAGSGTRGGGGSTAGGTGKEKEETGGGKPGKRGQFVPEHEIERAIADFKTSLADISSAMYDEEKHPTALGNLVETINKEDVDIIFAGSTLPAIVDKKLDTIITALETIDKKKLNAADLSHYQSEFQKAFDKNKKDLATLRDAIDTFGTHEQVEKQKEEVKKMSAQEREKINIKTDVSTLSKQKQWAYFGLDANELPDNEDTQKLKENISTPVSLFDIKDKINNIFENIKKFSEKKSDVPVEIEKAPEEPKTEEVQSESFVSEE